MKIFYQTFSITTKLISIFLLIILAQSCTKDTNCGDQSKIENSYYISADDKSKIPFKGNDTLTYISDAGDTAILIGSGKREFIDKVRTVIGGNADCYKYNVDNNETISIEYTGDNIELNRIKYKIYGNKEKTEIEFTINSYYGITYPYNFNTPVFYTDSTMINGNFYYGRPLGLNSSNYKAQYNFNYGFLKIQINGGKVWILKI
jgi:hypothetical protein